MDMGPRVQNQYFPLVRFLSINGELPVLVRLMKIFGPILKLEHTEDGEKFMIYVKINY